MFYIVHISNVAYFVHLLGTTMDSQVDTPLADLRPSSLGFTVTVKVDAFFSWRVVDIEQSMDRPAMKHCSFDVVFYDRQVCV